MNVQPMKPVARNSRFLQYLPLSLACCALATLSSPKCQAQARQTATKSADIGVFGGFTYADPTYGPDNVSGGMFGADFTRYVHLPVEPSLEFRANFISGTYVGQHEYLVGLRAAAPFRTIKPYADFLVGPGYIHFPLNYGYTDDNSIVYNYGGGVDVRVTHSFALKLDVQGQHWNTGTLIYRPVLGTVGVQYTIPFRPHVSQRDLGR
jgi:hypothetical protein